MRSTRASFVAVLLGIALAIFSTAATAVTVSAAPALVLQGPVDSVNRNRSQVTVLGHSFAVSRPSAFAVGNQVAVYGWLAQDGQLIVERVQSLGRHVPGASRVVVSGRVSRVQAATGRISVGSVLVDYTQLLSIAPSLEFSAGSLVRLAGTQSQLRGVITASLASYNGKPYSDVALVLTAQGIAVVAIDGGRTDGVITGTNGIITGTNGIITGTNGIITGTNGIITGTNVIITGTNGIITGTNGIITGTNGIITGTNGIITGTNGIITGTNGIITGTNGIITGTNGIITGTNGIITGTNGIITGTNGIITGTNGIITGTN